MNKRIYVCHTFYHVYVACLKEFHIRHTAQNNGTSGNECAEGSSDAACHEEIGAATLLLSKMSNHFDTLVGRARLCGLFEDVIEFDEKPDTFFPELTALHTDTGSLIHNMCNRIRYCRKFAILEKPYVPVDFKEYDDIYVFCDSDPIGYYLNYMKIRYHAVEDGLDCIRYGDTARFDNNGHFALKAAMAATGLIFIQNGYGKYCIDMEVNNISILEYPCKKYIEQPREQLVSELTQEDKELMLRLFVANLDELMSKLAESKSSPRVLVLSEPLCSLKVRERIFRDIINEYGRIDEKKAVVMIKQHPRDYMDYNSLFPDITILDGSFPMEMLNFIPGLRFDRLVSVYTVVDSIKFVNEKIFLGDDFMDRYEAADIHRINEQIKP